MRSKTSFFNPTLFGKNVTRFWPLWVLYTVIWVIVLPLPALNELRIGGWRYMDGLDFHWNLLSSVQALGIPWRRCSECWRPWRCSAICTRAAPPA